MRITISGAQSTGKTTLAHDLASQLPNSRVEPEPFRVLRASLGLVSGVDSMTPEQELALIEHNQRRLGAVRAGELALFDRCALDALAHAIVAHEQGNPAFSAEWLERLRQATDETMQAVDRIILVPVTSTTPLHADGVRSTDVGYRDFVDQAMHRITAEDPRLLIVTGDRSARVEQILDQLPGYR